MDKELLRSRFQNNAAAFDLFKIILFPDGINYCNPDFLLMDEDAARAGKVFNDDTVDFPTDDEIEEDSTEDTEESTEDTEESTEESTTTSDSEE